MPKFEEALEAAISQATGESSAPDAPTTQAAQTPETQAPETPSESAPETEAPQGTPTTPPPEVTQAAPNTGTPTAPAAKPTAPTGQQVPQAGNAPRSWAPAVREHWATLPREVKDAVLKREGEVARLVSESGQARQVAEAFERTVSPYRAFLGAEPMREVGNLLQTAVTLRTGTQEQKAAMVAQVVQAFGVDVAALDAALSGQQPQPGSQQAPGQYRDPRLDALLSHLGQQKTQREQQTRQRLQQELDAFAAQAEFYEDVRVRMGTLMEAALKEGRDMSLQEAYDTACYLDTGIRATLQKREAEKAAQTQSQQAQQARYAAGSVQSQPAPPAGSRKPSFDEALAAAINGR